MRLIVALSFTLRPSTPSQPFARTLLKLLLRGALVTNNTRFLIPPWVQVRELASHALSQIAHRLSSDWQAKYGHPIYLLETFVQRDCFLGTAYQAANWVRVGQTKGRSRQDQANGAHQRVPIKDIYLRPLHPQFRQRLGACATSP